MATAISETSGCKLCQIIDKTDWIKISPNHVCKLLLPCNLLQIWNTSIVLKTIYPHVIYFNQINTHHIMFIFQYLCVHSSPFLFIFRHSNCGWKTSAKQNLYCCNIQETLCLHDINMVNLLHIFLLMHVVSGDQCYKYFKIQLSQDLYIN